MKKVKSYLKEPKFDSGWFFMYGENLIYGVIFCQVTRFSVSFISAITAWFQSESEA